MSDWSDIPFIWILFGIFWLAGRILPKLFKKLGVRPSKGHQPTRDVLVGTKKKPSPERNPDFANPTDFSQHGSKAKPIEPS